MDYFPLLDIQQAIRDADRNLADVVDYIETLQAETAGCFPPDAVQMLAHVAAARERVGRIMTPALREAMQAEQTLYDEEETRYGG